MYLDDIIALIKLLGNGGGGGGEGTTDHRRLTNRNAANQHSISSITGLADIIPEQVDSDNPLADKNFVNSSISTNTAYYISDNGQPFASLAALEAYEGEVTNNDYAFVVGTDGAGNTIYTRYKYNDEAEEWAEEYVLNNSSFTEAQWEAINSGITAGLVSDVDFMLNYGLVYDAGIINITWDGDMTDREAISTGGNSYMVKVSDAVLSATDIIGATVSSMMSAVDDFIVTSSSIMEVSGAILVTVGSTPIIATGNNVNIGTGVIDGTYFLHANSGYIASLEKVGEAKITQNGEDVTQEVESVLEKKSTRFTFSATAPTADISDGGIHIVVLSEEPAVKYNGYIYLIEEA